MLQNVIYEAIWIWAVAVPKKKFSCVLELVKYLSSSETTLAREYENVGGFFAAAQSDFSKKYIQKPGDEEGEFDRQLLAHFRETSSELVESYLFEVFREHQMYFKEPMLLIRIIEDILEGKSGAMQIVHFLNLETSAEKKEAAKRFEQEAIHMFSSSTHGPMSYASKCAATLSSFKAKCEAHELSSDSIAIHKLLSENAQHEIAKALAASLEKTKLAWLEKEILRKAKIIKQRVDESLSKELNLPQTFVHIMPEMETKNGPQNGVPIQS